VLNLFFLAPLIAIGGTLLCLLIASKAPRRAEWRYDRITQPNRRI